MLSLIYQSILIIVVLTLPFGAAFFTLINTGIKYGYRLASWFVAGVIISDFVICMFICAAVYYGGTNLLQSEKSQTFLSIVGGIILIIFGSFCLKKPVVKTDTSLDIKIPSPSVFVFKGFFLNIFNPSAWIIWLANVTALSKSLDYSLLKMMIYFSFIIAIVLLIELAKAHVASSIKKYLTDRLLSVINYVTGIALIGFGVVLIYKYFFY